MVRATQHAVDGLFATRRPRHRPAARSHACTYWRSTRLLGSRCRAGLDHPQRSSHCNSRIRFRSARKGERRRALTDTDTAGASNTGCSASAAWPLNEGYYLNQQGNVRFSNRPFVVNHFQTVLAKEPKGCHTTAAWNLLGSAIVSSLASCISRNRDDSGVVKLADGCNA